MSDFDPTPPPHPPRASRATREASTPLGLALQVALLHQAHVLERRLTTFAEAGTDAEADAVHRVRTAARRMRAALVRFGPLLGGRTHDARRAVKRLLRAFGRARDLDVQIAGLEGRLGRDDGVRDAARLWLLERARQARRDEPARLRRAVRRFRADRHWTRLSRRLTRRPFDLRGPRPALAAGHSPREAPETLDVTRPLQEQVGELLQPARATLATLSRRLLDPDDVEGHHALRIAAKALRYELELLRPWLPVGARAEGEALVTLQDALGALHDLDVAAHEMIGHLRDALAEPRRALDAWPDSGARPELAGRARHLRSELAEGVPAGLCLLLQDVIDLRATSLGAARAAWRHFAARRRFDDVPGAQGGRDLDERPDAVLD